MENSRPKPGRMEETLEGGRGPPRAVEPVERERERERKRETDRQREKEREKEREIERKRK